MQIAVASGKGGTGKTLLSTSMTRVLSTSKPILIDADVEEPNAALLISGKPDGETPVFRPIPKIDIEKCTFCGRCAEICQFNALLVLNEQVLVYSELCHSCGACSYLCPEQAIKEENHPIGKIEKYTLQDDGRLLSGRLIVGETQSPPLIKACKNVNRDNNDIIIDCPPGTTCPMIEAIRDSDFCLMVTEPTPFGMHDLELSIEAAQLTNIPVGLVINRWRGDDGTIAELAEKHQIPVLGRIPLSTSLAKSYARGDDLFIGLPELKDITENILYQIKELVHERNTCA